MHTLCESNACDYLKTQHKDIQQILEDLVFLSLDHDNAKCIGFLKFLGYVEASDVKKVD